MQNSTIAWRDENRGEMGRSLVIISDDIISGSKSTIGTRFSEVCLQSVEVLRTEHKRQKYNMLHYY